MIKKLKDLSGLSKKKFQLRKKKKEYNSYSDIIRNMDMGTGIKLFIFFLCLGTILRLGQLMSQAAYKISNAASDLAIQAISNNLGEDMITDERGNVNVLLIGFGGGGHAGSFLADSIILASYNTELNSISMISIPRDLYINRPGKYSNKINAVFAYEYSNSGGDLDFAAQELSNKVGEILGLEIPYHALIDFSGFESFVDNIGGIEIDVPYPLYDTRYPNDRDNGYITFQIDAGLQQIDGATALKYARSRQTTSDFSRSQRQQIIIKGVIEKIRNSGTFRSPSALQGLYKQYTNMIHTNISFEEMIGMIPYIKTTPEIHSFGLTMECTDLSWRTMQPGCLLYPGVRDDFNGMSVLIPRGSNSRNVSMYDYLNLFGFSVVKNPGFLGEQTEITVFNGIDQGFARRFRFRNGLANSLASKLIRYGFTITDVGNADENREKTLVQIFGQEGSYQETIKMLRLYFDFEVEYIQEQQQNEISNTEISDTQSEWVDPLLAIENTETIEETKTQIHIILGNDFIERFGNRPFDIYGN